MKSSVKLITAKGITVYLHFTFLLFAAWLVIMFVASGMQLTQLAWSFLLVIASFLCIVVHEYAHAFVAARFGISAKRITLYPIGGIASIEKLPQNPKQELAISAAGPFVSFCIAGFLFLFTPQEFSAQSLKQYTGILSKTNFLYALAMVNMVLAIFNLIHAYPLDGGRILRALFDFCFKYIKATAIVAAISKVMAVIVILVGLLTLNFLLALVGVFIILFARAEELYLQLRSLVSGIQLREVLMYDYNSLDADLTANEAANFLENNHSKYFIIMKQGMPVGTLNRIEVMKAVADHRNSTKISSLMQGNVVHLDAGMPIENILDAISGKEDRLYPVFDNGQFVGVVSFSHIIEYLLLHKISSTDYDKTRSLVELV